MKAGIVCVLAAIVGMLIYCMVIDYGVVKQREQSVRPVHYTGFLVQVIRLL